MKKLWNFVNGLEIRVSVKNELYLGLMILINAIIGGALWALLGRYFLGSVEWLICFMGYFGIFIGLFGGALYLYNHNFA